MNLFSKFFSKKDNPDVPEEVPATLETIETIYGKLKSMSDPKCKKCYGRGYTAINRTTRKIMGCRCLRKMSEKKQKEHEHGKNCACQSTVIRSTK